MVYSCRCLGMMIKPDIYVSLRFHLEPRRIIAFNCHLLAPTHNEMYNEIQKRFTAASAGGYVKQYGYRNANQFVTISPRQLEQNKNIGAGQRTHVSSVSSTMCRLHFRHSLNANDSRPGRCKNFPFSNFKNANRLLRPTQITI